MIRRSAGAFDPLFFERSPLFWPIARAARTFAREVDWPDVSAYASAFVGTPPVRFEPSAPVARRKRRATPIDPRTLYDARIAVDGCVPTRPRSWHDFLNALVWATFPGAKRALHERQHHALVSSLPAGTRRLPGSRSREHDALALLDEGGVVMLVGPHERTGVVFGHALYEGIVLGVRAMAARVVEARVDEVPEDEGGRVRWADAVLEAALRGGSLVPESLPRIALAELSEG